MEGFCIEVHGIKGTLANIGAIPLSEKALDLENASKAAEAGFCSEHLPAFLDEIGMLNEDIKRAFSAIKLSDSPASIPPELIEIFEKLKEAFADMDLALIDREFEEIDALHLSGSLIEELEKIKDAVMMMDYERAIEYIGQLMNSE